MSIVSNIIYAITDIRSSNIISGCATFFAQIEMFLIQCYNSTVSLGYPPTCNEAFTYLSTSENTLQNRPCWKCIFLRLSINSHRKQSFFVIPCVALLVSKPTKWLRLFFVPNNLVMLITVYQTNTEHRASSLYNESNAQNKFTFKCWSCHIFNVLHQLSSFFALCFAIFADEVVLLIFVLQTFSWNRSIYFVCSPLSSLETFRNICVTLCCKKNTARHRT